MVQRLEGGSGLPLLPHVQTAELPARARVPKDTLEADMRRDQSGEEVKVPLPGGGNTVRARAEDEAVANRPNQLSSLPRGAPAYFSGWGVFQGQPQDGHLLRWYMEALLGS